MNLNLFNFDEIRDARVGNRYFIIDINYFLGYVKMEKCCVMSRFDGFLLGSSQ